MVSKMRVSAAIVALFCAFAGFNPSAHAFGKHAPKPPRAQQRSKKNTSPYAYLAPKKQKKQNGGWYQSPVSGQMLYGNKKK